MKKIVLNILNKMFLNTYFPSNEVLKKKIKDELNIDINCIERNVNDAIITIEDVSIKMSYVYSSTGLLKVNNIEIL